MNSDQQDKGLQSLVVFDRSTASRLGLSPQLIDDTLYDAFGQRQVSIMYTPLNQYHVVMEVAPQYWQSPAALHDIYVRSPTGAQVPLSAVTRYEPTQRCCPSTTRGSFPASRCRSIWRRGRRSARRCRRSSKSMREIGLPGDIRGTFPGHGQGLSSFAVENQPLLILAALVTVYIVLGILYESYIHPLTILSTLPSAGVGALLALLLFKTELSMIALIGIILLIGIVKKNAIMMIDFAAGSGAEGRGRPPEEAIYEACLMRFRPIMMTTMAALLGALPLASGWAWDRSCGGRSALPSSAACSSASCSRSIRRRSSISISTACGFDGSGPAPLLCIPPHNTAQSTSRLHSRSKSGKMHIDNGALS